jgi:hypothetical protein
MQDLPAPANPLQAWRSHLYHPLFGFFWFFEEPFAIVTQTTVARADMRGAEVFLGLVDQVVSHHVTRFAAGGQLLLWHDWRSLRGYDSDARIKMHERIRQRPKHYVQRTVVVISPSPLWRMAFAVTDLTFALLGVPAAAFTADVRRAYAEIAHFERSKPPAWLPSLAPG